MESLKSCRYPVSPAISLYNPLCSEQLICTVRMGSKLRRDQKGSERAQISVWKVLIYSRKFSTQISLFCQIDSFLFFLIDPHGSQAPQRASAGGASTILKIVTILIRKGSTLAPEFMSTSLRVQVLSSSSTFDPQPLPTGLMPPHLLSEPFV